MVYVIENSEVTCVDKLEYENMGYFNSRTNILVGVKVKLIMLYYVYSTEKFSK